MPASARFITGWEDYTIKLTALVRNDVDRLVWTITLADQPEYVSSHPDLSMAKDMFTYTWTDIVTAERDLADQVIFEFVEV